ncbi:hypothetical protein [Photobacterium leiognathi]|uniref:hypothetical protein n=1 Tax=Photobacterium leiognathi TaxID=553611 RepID=UPI0027394892|nr:hypothetical protein [Photobacterium leiognathi]
MLNPRALAAKAISPDSIPVYAPTPIAAPTPAKLIKGFFIRSFVAIFVLVSSKAKSGSITSANSSRASFSVKLPFNARASETDLSNIALNLIKASCSRLRSLSKLETDICSA